MRLTSSPERRLLIAVDMQRYSNQTNLDQYESQRTLRDGMQEAAAAAGLSREQWVIQPTGDGEFSVLPPTTPESTVITSLVTRLDLLLRQHNRSLARHAHVRVRFAVHTGPVHLDGANGIAGEGAVVVNRLVNTTPLKQALDDFPDAGVGLVVSEPVYRDVVLHRYEGLRPERFQRVDAQVKEFAAPAWIYIPDEDVSGRPRPEPLDPKPGQEKQQRRTGSEQSRSFPVQGNTFHGPAVIGSGVAAEHIEIGGEVRWST